MTNPNFPTQAREIVKACQVQTVKFYELAQTEPLAETLLQDSWHAAKDVATVALTRLHYQELEAVLEGVKEHGTHKWWHELSCPAHSNQMQPEDECDCLYEAVMEDIDQALAEVRREMEAK